MLKTIFLAFQDLFKLIDIFDITSAFNGLRATCMRISISLRVCVATTTKIKFDLFDLLLKAWIILTFSVHIRAW
jgi:hypothetical protein